MAETAPDTAAADAVRLHWDDAQVGREAPVVVHRLSRTDFVRYAGASGDLNPMHHDEIKATEAGMPSVFGHGMLSMGIVGRAVTDWVGVAGLRELSVRFTRQTWPGEELRSKVVITEARVEGDDRLIEMDIELANDAGEVKVAGRAVAAL